MFVPSAVSILNALGASRTSFDEGGTIQVPVGLLKLLLQVALASSDFDEAGYLRANPDVAEAMKKGEIDSARVHYIGFGYFEGRQGAGPEVDEKWYLEVNPDVAAAVRDKKVPSAADHFHAIGAGEGRSPSAEHADDALQWKAALRSK